MVSLSFDCKSRPESKGRKQFESRSFGILCGYIRKVFIKLLNRHSELARMCRVAFFGRFKSLELVVASPWIAQVKPKLPLSRFQSDVSCRCAFSNTQTQVPFTLRANLSSSSPQAAHICITLMKTNSGWTD